MQKIFVFSDVDDTLLCSRRKVPENLNVVAVAKNKEGADAGFSSLAQIRLVELICDNGTLIPVTGRNKETLYLYRSNWESSQIVSHGAVIINKDGSPDEDWLKHIEPELEEAHLLLQEVLESISSIKLVADSDGRCRLIRDQGVSCYFCAKYSSQDVLLEIEREILFLKAIDPRFVNWKIHSNGNNVAFLPPYASKARATKFLQEKLGVTPDDLTIGIGDSVSDLDFMNLCTFKLLPNSSQIDNKLNSFVAQAPL